MIDPNMAPNTTYSLAISLITIIAFLTSTIAATCNITPIYLSFGDQILANGIGAYGAKVGLWTGLAVHVRADVPEDSYVGDERNCTGPVTLVCTEDTPIDNRDVLCGGQYYVRNRNLDPGEYDKYIIQFLESGENGDSRTDTLTIGDVVLNQYSLNVRRMQRTPDFPANYLGLGFDSKILDALIKESLITTKSWSFFPGWRGTEVHSQREGSLVIGGYDKSLVGRDTRNIPMTVEDGCPLRFKSKSLRLKKDGDTSGGTSLQSSEDLDICIDTRYYGMKVPRGMFEEIVKLAGVRTVDTKPDGIYNASGTLLWSEEQPRFSLITNIDGLDIEIPYHLLIGPQRYATPKSFEVHAASLGQVLHITPHDSATAVFGWPFLGAAYLIVELEKKQFSLSPLPPKGDNQINIFPIQDPSCPEYTPPAPTSTNSRTGTASGPTATTSTQDADIPEPPTRKASDSGSLGVPEIAGIAGGTCAGFLLIGFGIFLLIKRKARPDSLMPLPDLPPGAESSNRALGGGEEGRHWFSNGKSGWFGAGQPGAETEHELPQLHGAQVYQSDSREVYQMEDDLGPQGQGIRKSKG